jgi:peptidyl-tRNA hydrolase
MNPTMYLILNRSLGMSAGKIAAQASHAAVKAYRISDPKMIDKWYLGNHYTKIVLMADDETQLSNMQEYIEVRGFKTQMIIDEGRTEIPAFTKTALGIEIVDKSDPHVQETFSEFKIYKEVKEEVPVHKFCISREWLSRSGKNYFGKQIGDRGVLKSIIPGEADLEYEIV